MRRWQYATSLCNYIFPKRLFAHCVARTAWRYGIWGGFLEISGQEECCVCVCEMGFFGQHAPSANRRQLTYDGPECWISRFNSLHMCIPELEQSDTPVLELPAASDYTMRDRHLTADQWKVLRRSSELALSLCAWDTAWKERRIVAACGDFDQSTALQIDLSIRHLWSQSCACFMQS